VLYGRKSRLRRRLRIRIVGRQGHTKVKPRGHHGDGGDRQDPRALGIAERRADTSGSAATAQLELSFEGC